MNLELLTRFISKDIQVPGTNLFLRPPQNSDYAKWRDLRADSEVFLQRWEPKWPSDDLTKIGYQRRMKAYNQQRQNGSGRTFFLFENQNNQLLGGISLTHITYHISNSASLGYWMGVHHAGQGHMKKAVPAILDYAYNNLFLNRVEAACLPYNDRSIHLLTSCGFQKEGFARQYLEINGQAEDHILFAKLKADH